MANETKKYVQAKSKQAMKQVLWVRDKKARMKVTPRRWRWHPLRRRMTCDGTRMTTASFSNILRALRARSQRPRNTPQESSSKIFILDARDKSDARPV